METRYEELFPAVVAFARRVADFRLRPDGSSEATLRDPDHSSRTGSDAIRGVRTSKDAVAISGLFAFRGELNGFVSFALAFP